MHHNCKIILPPIEVDRIEEAVAEVMAPFQEDGTDEGGNPLPHTFWDYYTLGGRWASDTCLVSELEEGANAFRVILAGPNYEGTGLEAVQMIEADYWNGVSHVDSAWDGRVATAIDWFTQRLENYTDSYRSTHCPLGNWLCVTVDYHS